MRQSAILPAERRGNYTDASLDVGPNYPFSAQYKGDGWYLYNAATNTWGTFKFITAALAEEHAATMKQLQETVNNGR